MNILITGCNGQLGNELQLLEKEHAENRYFNTDVEQLDITDQDAVTRYVEENDIHGIIHCAAYTAVDKAETEQELCRRLNAEAPRYLARAIDRRGGWIIQISTDYVFDGTKHTPYNEADQANPSTFYGKTKLEGEKAIMQECKQAMIIRTAWLYSTFGNNFVKTMIQLGKERHELGVIFDQIGTPTYARDLAAIIMAAIRQKFMPGVYHFSNEGVTSWYDFAKVIHRLAGIKNCNVRPLHTEEYPTPARRPAYGVLDKTKIKQTYNLEIPYWEDSLAECIELLQAMKID